MKSLTRFKIIGAELVRAPIVWIVMAAAAIGGCAGLQGGGIVTQSPEAQIVAGAQAVTATATVATVALRNNVITVQQARGFRAFLDAASTALDSANVTLIACRKETGTIAGAISDPCRPKVMDLVNLALDSVANVRAKLPAN